MAVAITSPLSPHASNKPDGRSCKELQYPPCGRIGRLNGRGGPLRSNQVRSHQTSLTLSGPDSPTLPQGPQGESGRDGENVCCRY